MHNQEAPSQAPTQIRYVVTAYIAASNPEDAETYREHLSCVHEFEVREFLFTDDEIEEDVER